MKKFEEILESVLVWEGHDKITDDENDAGGLTRWGITAKTLGAWKKIPAAEITISHMKNLSKSDAAEIYLSEYYKATGCNKLGRALALCVFDTAVNLGVPKSARMLQSLVGAKQDGHIGPKTIKAVKAADEKKLLLDLMGRRLQYYTTRPSYKHHGFGWFRRVLDIHSQAMNTKEEEDNGS